MSRGSDTVGESFVSETEQAGGRCSSQISRRGSSGCLPGSVESNTAHAVMRRGSSQCSLSRRGSSGSDGGSSSRRGSSSSSYG